MKNDLHALSDGVNALEQWRFKESQSLGSLVQRRIKFLQVRKHGPLCKSFTSFILAQVLPEVRILRQQSAISLVTIVT